VRLVAATRPRTLPIGSYAAHSYDIGLRVAVLLKEHFPAWYAEYVAGLPVTPQHLYGIALAFLALVHRERFALEETWDWPLVQGDIAIGAFMTGEQDEDVCLSTLQEGAWYLLKPQPALYGVGLELAQGHGDDLEWQDLHYSELTLALWHVARQTGWGIGASLDNLVDGLPDRAASAIRALPLLPRDTPMDDLVAALDARTELRIGGVGRGTLVAYVFSRTDCWAANVSNEEIRYCYEGETGFDWSQIADWPTEIKRAQAIARAHERWREQVDGDLAGELELLADLLHTERRRLVRRRGRKDKTLIEVLDLSNPTDEGTPLIAHRPVRRDPTMADDYPFNLDADEVEA